MRSIIFLAARPLDCGTELLVDYRIATENDDHPLPEWYPRDKQVGSKSTPPVSNKNMT